MARSEGTTPYEMAHRTDRYGLPLVLAAAERVGDASIPIPALAAGLEDADAAVRYWSVVALQARGRDAASARDAVARRLGDPSAAVALEAASTVCGLGYCTAAYPPLARYLRSDDRPWETLLAAAVIRDLGERARPLLAEIQAARARHGGAADGRYRDWMFSMFVGFALDQALANLAAEPTGGPMSSLVSASDPHVAVMGRVFRPDPARIRFGYPGVTLRLRFEGPSLSMRIEAETPNSHVAVFVDGGPARVVRLRQGESDVALAEGLGEGPHSVDVVHRTETWMGTLTVRGFRLSPSGRLLDPEPWPKRRMLFLGDSVTCGERIDREPGETEPFASSNGYLSYGMRLARALDAQCHLVCYGGRGLVRDWRGRTDVLTIPRLFDLAVADEEGGPSWDHSAYTPDVVFVSVGTNDFNLATGPLPDREGFVSAYVSFVWAILSRHPNAHVVLTEGAIVNDAADPKRPQKTVLREYLDETARRLGDARVHVVPSQHYPGDASNAHPTGDQHAAIVRDLEPAIRQIMGW